MNVCELFEFEFTYVCMCNDVISIRDFSAHSTKINELTFVDKPNQPNKLCIV